MPESGTSQPQRPAFRGRHVRPPTGALVAEVAFRVPFHDVDSMQVVWHGNYVKYFELARTELEERLGLPVDVIEGMGLVCPIVECHARYLSPLRNGDRARCRAWILDWDRKLTLGYEVLNETTHRKSAEGYTVQVALRRDTFELVLELPDALVDPVRAAAGIRPGNGPGK